MHPTACGTEDHRQPTDNARGQLLNDRQIARAGDVVRCWRGCDFCFNHKRIVAETGCIDTRCASSNFVFLRRGVAANSEIACANKADSSRGSCDQISIGLCACAEPGNLDAVERSNSTRGINSTIDNISLLIGFSNLHILYGIEFDAGRIPVECRQRDARSCNIAAGPNAAAAIGDNDNGDNR